jgi:hypothetical protein
MRWLLITIVALILVWVVVQIRETTEDERFSPFYYNVIRDPEEFNRNPLEFRLK